MVKARFAARLLIEWPIFDYFFPRSRNEGVAGVIDSHRWTGLPYLRRRTVRPLRINFLRWS